MKYLVFLLLFASCTTYKAYQKVAADPFVDAREGVLLSQKCLATYPLKLDTPRVKSVTDDSAAYQATIDGLLMMIDTLAAALDQQDRELSFIDTNDFGPPPCKIRPQDSLRIIKNFLKFYRVPPVIRVVEKEVPTLDTKTMEISQANIRACTAENARLQGELDKATARLTKKNAATGWIVGVGLLAVIVAYGAGRLGRKTIT